MNERKKIAEFQSRLAGLILGHGTHVGKVESILQNGLTEEYNYACVDEGWEIHDDNHRNVKITADAVAERTYPDPEGQWGPAVRSMREYVLEVGLEAALDELERCLNGEGWLEDLGDPTDPNNYNLVIVGPVPASAIVR